MEVAHNNDSSACGVNDGWHSFVVLAQCSSLCHKTVPGVNTILFSHLPFLMCSYPILPFLLCSCSYSILLFLLCSYPILPFRLCSYSIPLFLFFYSPTPIPVFLFPYSYSCCVHIPILLFLFSSSVLVLCRDTSSCLPSWPAAGRSSVPARRNWNGPSKQRPLTPPARRT